MSRDFCDSGEKHLLVKRNQNYRRSLIVSKKERSQMKTKLLLCLLLIASLSIVSKLSSEFTIYVQPDTLYSNSTGNKLFVWLENPEIELIALDFVIEFDLDFFPVTAVNKTDRSDSMDIFQYFINFQLFPTRIVMYGSIKPGLGPVAELTVDVNEDVCGNHLWNIKCLVSGKCTGLEKEITVISTNGNDVNGDGCTDIQDVMAVVNHMLGISKLPQDAIIKADCNSPKGSCDGDGSLNALDVVKIVNIILGNDWCSNTAPMASFTAHRRPRAAMGSRRWVCTLG